MKRVAIIGTVGVPASYGGFETLVENIIGNNCSPNIQYTVFCSSKAYNSKLKSYKGAKLKYIPLQANGFQSIPYDIWSILNALYNNDVLLILGVSGSIVLPIIRLCSKKKIIINIDGLEHKRIKWGCTTRKLLKFLEKVAVYNADIVVSDNKSIQDYVKEEYSTQSELIAYGGDHSLCDISNIEQQILKQYGLVKGEFNFSLCRIEPENNVHLILEAFQKEDTQELVFVGNWQNSSYGRALLTKYETCSNIMMLNPIYDLSTLNVLRCNCKFYIHGHSAGGTNPSLVEAMHFGMPILAYDVCYNRETTENKAQYFTNADELFSLLKTTVDGDDMLEIARRRYLWSTIAKQYENIY